MNNIIYMLNRRYVAVWILELGFWFCRNAVDALLNTLLLDWCTTCQFQSWIHMAHSRPPRDGPPGKLFLFPTSR